MRLFRHSWTLGPLVLFMASLACSTGQVPRLGRASGTFDLDDPASGLAALSSYRAVLQRSFDGTDQGQASPWSDKWTLIVSRESQARLLTLDATTADEPFSGAVIGEMGGVAYSRLSAGDACRADPSSEVQQPAALEPAGLLPPLSNAEEVGDETVAGLTARHYRLDGGSLNTTADVSAQGDVWIEAGRGFVVKYSLTVEAGEEYFGDGIAGTMRWEYELSAVDQPIALLPPEGCPPGMIDVPLPADAESVERSPGMTTFTTQLTVPDAVAYFANELPGQGWQPVEEPNYGDEYGAMLFSRQEQQLMIGMIREQTTEVTLVLQDSGAAQAAGSGATPAAPGPGSDPTATIAASLNRTLGIGDQGMVLPSYHLEASDNLPEPYTLVADVEGQNIHILYTKGGVTTDGYIIGEEQYELVGGALVSSPGTIKLAWISWSLEPTMALGIASTGPALQGQEDYEGRTVAVYAMNSDDAPPGILEAVQAFSDVSTARGRAWIDEETGALLKLVLDYVSDKGQGHVEITVTQIGQVTVQLP